MTERVALPTLPDRRGASSAASVGLHGRFRITGVLGAGGMGIVLEAHDPDLDRPVAIKVLHPELLGATDRLAREARAMARVPHPNVVTVFEVGRIDGRAFVAMELVNGITARAWMQTRRPWRAIVAMFVGAGRGLEAAHRVDLVHRDFKPDNVLIGVDGRPRVSDFGLVEPLDVVAGAPPDASVAGATADATTSRPVAGTPAYLAPELWQGLPATPRSDQFAFCVSLWEALYGERPFASDADRELGPTIAGGRLREPAPARRRDVPRWLEAALRQGLAADVALRWPSMTVLLDLVERRARRTRWWIPAAAASVATALTAAAVWHARPEPIQRCAAPNARLDAVWSPAQRGTLASHLIAVDPVRGVQRTAFAAERFDGHRAAWSSMYVETCRATHVDGRQSGALLDRRMRCLDRALLELEQSVRVVENASSPSEVDGAMSAAATLPSLEDCADESLLLESVPPPVDAAARRQLTELDREVAELTVARRAGRVLRGRALTLVARARALAFAPSLARALDLLVGDLLDGDDGAAAVETLRELTLVAATAREDWIAARAWVRLVRIHAEILGNPAEAQSILLMARAAVSRAGDPPELRYDLMEAESTLRQTTGDLERARSLVQEGLALLEAAGAGRTGRESLTERRSAAVFNLGLLLSAERRSEEAVVVLRRGRALRAELFGEGHSDLARIDQALGEALRQAGRREEALDVWREAARVADERLPPSQLRAILVARVGALLTELGRPDEGLPFLERGVAMAKQVMPAESETLALLVADHGTAMHATGQSARARDAFLATLVRLEQAGESVNLAITLYNLGDLEADLGDCRAAMTYLQRSDATFARVLGQSAGLRAYPQVRAARCHLELREWRDALAAAEWVLALDESRLDAEQRLHARYVRGRARYDSGRERVHALAEVRAVQDELARHPEMDALDVEAWLSVHR
jgi:eukaryotic-like serine/threonine-protein kinase